jgi:hypothetical protein
MDNNNGFNSIINLFNKKIRTIKNKLFLENKKEIKFKYRTPLDFYDIIINIDTIKDLIKKG